MAVHQCGHIMDNVLPLKLEKPLSIPSLLASKAWHFGKIAHSPPEDHISGTMRKADFFSKGNFMLCLFNRHLAKQNGNEGF